MSYTITDNIANLFQTSEVSLVITAYLAQDIGTLPSTFMVPPTSAAKQGTATADGSGNFALSVPLDQPVYLAAASALNPGTYYWAVGRNVDLGLAAGSVAAGGATSAQSTVFGEMGRYDSTLPTVTSGRYNPIEEDRLGRELKGNTLVNLLTHASAADTGITLAGTTTYDNSAAYYDVSLFDEICIKWNATTSAGGSSPTIQLLVDLIDAQGIIFQVYASDAMTTTAGALTLFRHISIGKGAPTVATNVVQGVNCSLAGCKMRMRVLGGGSTSNTSITYSLTIDAR